MLNFQRVADAPLLGLDAVPWCAEEERPRPSVICPTVVDMAAFAGVLPNPIDRFYMYYAPHHSHGMGLATAPHPEGPWTPYPGNPLLRLADAPGLRTHISSPELVYRPERPEAPFWLYFHGRAAPRGGGQQTCVAASADAVHWRLLSPEPVLTATAGQTGEANTAAYARIWQQDGWLYALYKAETVHCLAHSRDGIAWEHWPRNPLMRPEAEHGEYGRIRHTGILAENGTLSIFYCTPTRDDLSREEIKLASFDAGADDWDEWGPLRRHGIVLSPELEWEAGDLRDPYPLRHDGSLYLYYVGGHEQGVGLARAPAGQLAQ